MKNYPIAHNDFYDD